MKKAKNILLILIITTLTLTLGISTCRMFSFPDDIGIEIDPGGGTGTGTGTGGDSGGGGGTVVHEMEEIEMDYTESTAMLSNPHMGYPTDRWITLNDSYTPATNHTGFNWYYVNIGAYSKGNDYIGYTEGVKGNNDWKGLGEKDEEIPEKVLDSFKTTLTNLRANGGSAIIRIVYTWDAYYGQEPDDPDIIIKHIEQICEKVFDLDDVVFGFQCGIIGPWGEMHTSRYAESKYANEIMETYLRNTKDSVYLLVRTPQFIVNYYNYKYSTNINRNQVAALKTVEGTDEYRLGYYNDGYMISESDLGTWNNRALELQFLASQDHIPYGGEFGFDYEVLPSEVCLPQNAIPEMYSTHLNNVRGNVFSRYGAYANKYFGYEDYDYGTPNQKPEYEKSWFPNNSAFYGKDCHTFITAHLGYRLVLRESMLSKNPIAGGELRLSGKIENTGFANVLCYPKTEILLVRNGSIDNTFPLSDFDAFDLKSCITYDYSFIVNLPASIATGNYDVYIRMYSTDKNKVKSGIQFANNGGIYNSTLGANKLGTITVGAATSP